MGSLDHELDAPVADGPERAIDRVASAAPGPERIAGGELFAESLTVALDALSERQRAAVLLRHQQGHSYAEIANALDVAEGTAKTLVHRGVQILRARLKEWSDA